MASFTVTLSDGSSYGVDGLPDDATEADALTAVLAQHPEAGKADNSLSQWLGVTNRALMPYAAAAAGGAAAGVPFAGVGAVPGAAAGVAALGLSDLGVGAYNLAATPFGAPPMTMPSEAIRQAYEATGMPGMRQPATPMQRIYSTGLEAAVPGGATAKALGVTAKTMTPGLARDVVTEMGRGARGQAIGGAASGAATQTAIEGGETDPTKLFLISLAAGAGGSLAGGKTPRPVVTGQDINNQARQFYRKMEQTGVRFSANASDTLANDLENTLRSLPPSISSRSRNQVLRVIRDLRNRPQNELSFEQLDVLRSDLGKAAYNPTTGRIDDTAALLAAKVQDELDGFIDNVTPAQITAGNAKAATDAVKNARVQWRNARKGEILEKVLSDVELKSGKRPAIDVLKSRLEPIVGDTRLMSKFTDEEQKVLKSLQSGTLPENVLAFLGRVSPGTNWKQILGYAVPASGAAAMQSPAAAGVVGGIATGSAVAQAAANRMAITRAADLTQNMLRGLPPGTTAENYMRNIGRMGSTYVPPVISGSAFANQENQNRMSR
jgi:hypothetical protein